MHNTFTLTEETPGNWVAQSHNFPEISASGTTQDLAIKNLSRAIVYYKDNNPKDYLKRVKERLQRGWICACGEPIQPDDLVIGVWG